MNKTLLKLTTIKQAFSFFKNWGLLALWVHFFTLTNPTATLIYTCLMFVQSFFFDYIFSLIQHRYFNGGNCGSMLKVQSTNN